LTRFLLGFSGFDSVFLVWLGFFFLFGFGLVRFFRFQAYKTETEPVGFFKILIGFFFTVRFFSFFFRFSRFNRFFDFFLTPNLFYDCKLIMWSKN
jgi:hypothetical protein